MITANEIAQAKQCLQNKQYQWVIEKLILNNDNPKILLNWEACLLRAEAYLNLQKCDDAQIELSRFAQVSANLLVRNVVQENDERINHAVLLEVRIYKAMNKNLDALKHLALFVMSEVDSETQIFYYAMKAEIEYGDQQYDQAVETATLGLDLITKLEKTKDKQSIKKIITTMQIEFDLHKIHLSLLSLRADSYLKITPVKMKESFQDSLMIDRLEDLPSLKRLSQLHLLERSPAFFNVVNVEEPRVNSAVHTTLADDEFLALFLQAAKECMKKKEYEQVVEISSMVLKRIPGNFEISSLRAQAIKKIEKMKQVENNETPAKEFQLISM